MSSEKDAKVAVIGQGDESDELVMKMGASTGPNIKLAEVGWITTAEDAYVTHFYFRPDGRTVVTKAGFNKALEAYQAASAVAQPEDAVRILLANLWPNVEFEED